jgi:hypothetical protein
MKIRTLNHLQDALDAEMAWRVKEIADLKSTINLSSGSRQITLIRAGVSLVYAHWEGFVKATSEKYLEYVNSQKIPLSDMTDSFVCAAMRSHINSAYSSSKFDQNIKIVDILRNKLDVRFSVDPKAVIDTASNLNSEVFSNIARFLSLDVNTYSTRFNFIDETLLARRNAVAHGEYIGLNEAEWSTIADDVILLLRHFKTDIENASVLTTYKRPLLLNPA